MLHSHSSSHPEPSDDAFAREHSAKLYAYIQEQAQAAGGALSFAQFMELALYAPQLGYYVAGASKLGSGGDFITAPDTSPLFGQCIAQQGAEVLQAIDHGAILEFGAGTGALAQQVITALHHLGRRVGRYFILEPSPDLRARQQAFFNQCDLPADTQIEWLTAWPRNFRGLILANEVVDAFPVQRFCIGDDGAILEWMVAPSTQEPGLVDYTQPASPELAHAVRQLQQQGLANTPGYEGEYCPTVQPWIASLADCLEAGLALIIDYGYPRKELYHPQRSMGTLLCYYQHRVIDDPYQHLGLQDITAHVDFTALAEAGLAAGCDLAGYTTQAHFLLSCGFDELIMEQLNQAPQQIALSLTAAARQLIHPAYMGERFKVLGLSRGCQQAWRGFHLRDLQHQLGCAIL
jgi:SAM-dependent MidA family methyltransferase